MRYLGNCSVALLTPWGRLSAVPFAVMAIALIAAHGFIQLHLTAAGDDLPPYNSWSMSYFAIMWVLFCIMSRRFHDAGKTALFLVPLLAAAFASYLYVFDNLHFADSDFAEDRAILAWAEHLQIIVRFAVLGTLGYAAVQSGDTGDNGFGPEFYRAKSAPPKASSRVAVQTGPRRIARNLNSAPPQPAAEHPKRQEWDVSGPRGRITPAESARNRRDGFGRR
jgi:uncharacterized membrane protein YhaH (DUF805 family)